MVRFAFIVIALLHAAVAPAASMNKCVDASGHVTFTQQACPDLSAGEQINIRPANSVQGSGSGRPGPSADKYIQPLDLSGDVTHQVRKIKAVVDIGVMKARDCDWSLKVSKEMDKCMDLLAYLIEGSTYNQAMAQAASYNTQEIAQVSTELKSIIRAASEIIQAKELALAYIRSP